MQVAVDCRYIRERPSGVGAYVEALAQRLPGNAPSVQFVFWRDSRARGPLSTARNVREVTVGVGPNSPLTILWPGLYVSLDGYELFHNPHNILPRGVRCPSVVTVHDVLAIDNAHLHRRGLNRLKGMYYPQAVWRALTSATRLIVPSVATADRVATWVPDAARRIHVIPMAPGGSFEAPNDPEATRRLAAERFGIDGPYVLVVGENSANKSHSTAILAFALAASPPYRLVLLQRLGRSGRLKRLASALGIADRVVWLTRVTREEVVLLMQGAHVLMQPSHYEGFGLPVIEAMACGCPVIASDIPALHEVSAAQPCSSLPGTSTALRAPFETCSPRPNIAGRLPKRESTARAHFHGIERRAKRRPSTRMSWFEQPSAPIGRSTERLRSKGRQRPRPATVHLRAPKLASLSQVSGSQGF